MTKPAIYNRKKISARSGVCRIFRPKALQRMVPRGARARSRRISDDSRCCDRSARICGAMVVTAKRIGAALARSIKLGAGGRLKRSTAPAVDYYRGARDLQLAARSIRSG